ncbi:MAG TPA: ABC transporter substrate-binding protein [Candidatus Methylomirabilis sp.]|nr:ABC transporter substrate-binding protein [Candidatus Methylomirabilis sp.]
MRHGTAYPLGVLAVIVMVLLLPERTLGQTATPDEAKAKTEGSVVYYTSSRTTTAEKHAKGFEKKYGIKVQIFRSGTEKVMAKLEAEIQAGRIQADVVSVSDPGYYLALQARGALLPYVSRYAGTIPAPFKDQDGQWNSNRVINMVMAYNTKFISADQAPRRWTDLTDPKWQGKITVASPSYGGTSLNWVAGMLKLYGWKFFEDLGKNKPLMTEGHQPGMQLVASGERLLSGEMNDYDARASVVRGQSVAIVIPQEGVVAIPSPMAIMKATVRPNAAKLFVDYLLSEEGQVIMVEDEYYYSPRTDVAPPKGAIPLGDLKVIPMDWQAVERQSEEIKTRFSSILGK